MLLINMITDSLSLMCKPKVGRTLQGFAADSAKKEKEKHILEHDIKRKEKRIKDLTDELEKVKSKKDSAVKFDAVDQNERLCTELEEKKRHNSFLQQDSNRLATLFHSLNVKDNQSEPPSHSYESKT